MRRRLLLLPILLIILTACRPEVATFGPILEIPDKPLLPAEDTGIIDWSGPPAQVNLQVREDDDEGWNLYLSLIGVRIDPRHVSSEHVPGEGYVRLYVDDVYIGRIYGDAYHLRGYGEGEHEIRVALAANTHQEYVIDGRAIDDVVTIQR